MSATANPISVVNPSASPAPISSLEEEANALINSARTKYDPANLNILSKYLNEQISHNTYDFNSNLTILHIYTLYPQCFDFDVCRKILIKGLMNLPNLDFSQYLFLIPENKAKDPRISCIIKFHDSLQACKIKQAWEELKEPSPNPLSDLLATPFFVESIRKYVADIVSVTWTNILLSDIMSLLNFSNVQEFEKFARGYGWTIITDEAGGARGGGNIVRINIKTDESTGASNAANNNMLNAVNMSNANKQINKSPVYTSQANALNPPSLTQRVAEKHMNIDSIRMCFNTLQR